MPQHARYYWGKRNGIVRYDFAWNQVTHDSVVLISASEGKPPISTAAPDRYVGDAVFTVLNIAPYDGGVEFGVRIDWDDPLDLWTDITVFDRTDSMYAPPSRFVNVA